MKRKSPYLMITTLLCVLFFSSCQKDDAGLQPQNALGQRIGGGAPDPIDYGIMIPLAGNAYITKPATGGLEAISSTGLTNWSDPTAITSTYFYLAKTGKLFVGFKASVPSGTSTVKVFVNGKEFSVTGVTGNTYKKYKVGIIDITTAGYVKVDLQGVSNTNNSAFATVSDVIVYGPAAAAVSDVFFANDAANYATSRAGAEASLKYTIPSGLNTEWFYNEMTVSGALKAGSDFISNGFSAGNSGLQVTAASEKRMTFFVSNTTTTGAKIVRLGANSTVGTSSQGKSIYMTYNWISGTTYKFLTQAKPDGSGNTIYSSWVYTPEDSQWKFIASCSRADGANYLSGLYSSVKGINTENSFYQRTARQYNQWVYANGAWSEITNATFTGDATATNKQRVDVGASVSYSAFSIKSLGFFSDNLALNSSLSRTATGNQPSVDFNSLP